MLKDIVGNSILYLQEQIFNAKGIRTDAHIFEGKGALFVQEGAPLTIQNVIVQIPYHMLMFGNISINF